MDIRVKKGDIFIIILILLISGIALVMTVGRRTGESVIITVNGNTTKYSLSENQTLQLKSDNGGFNTVIICDHEVYMEEASCPDQICVHHKAISKNGESILCLPNEVYIEIESEEEKETDN